MTTKYLEMEFEKYIEEKFKQSFTAWLEEIVERVVEERLKEIGGHVVKNQLEEITPQDTDQNAQPDKPKEWMNLKEAANYVGISYNSFKKYFVEEGLPVAKFDGLFRVSKTDIDTHLAHQKVKQTVK